MFVRQGVYTEKEAIARANIQLENYVKIINIEARTMLEMAKREIYPAVNAYISDLCATVVAKKSVSDKIVCTADEEIIEKLSVFNEAMMAAVAKLEKDLSEMPKDEGPASMKMAHVVLPDMEEIRRCADNM